jgi:uncharacterized SAM-binding protein YcdF (DUF218 family)
MKKRRLALLGLALIILCFVYIAARGGIYTVKLNVPDTAGGAEDYQVEIEQSGETVRLEDKQLRNGVLRLTFSSVSRGRAYIHITGPGFANMDGIYVHGLGIITWRDYFGDCTGGVIVPIAFALYLAVVLLSLIRQYREDVRRNLYQYRNVRNLGLMIYLGFMLLAQIPQILSFNGLIYSIRSVLNAVSFFAYFAFPVAFIVSILVTVSNIELMRKEGRNWRNMLGCILGILLCLSTLFPAVLGEVLQRSTVVDVHNENGSALYIEMAVEHTILVAISYLECILLGTIILSVKAAKKVPAFDKDHILILGCQIRKDGTLTNLLKGRADRAVEFARMQKEAVGKDLTFVPSGGKGDDEVIPEAEAIRNYLLSVGIDEDRIMVENRSANTYENMRNSMELIRESVGEAEPKIAFSTTNYHVFRAGIIASQQGILAEGIGSGTRSYFWINAFIREFAATVYSERKTHIRVIAVLILLVLAMIGTVYVSNNT